MDTQDQLSRAKIKLSTETPFFTEISYAQSIQLVDNEVEKFLVTAKGILINSHYFSRLRASLQISLVLHTCLHQALLHDNRRGDRNPRMWNLACDAVVNNIIKSTSKYPPTDATLNDIELKDLSAEEAYDVLYIEHSGNDLSATEIIQDLSSSAEVREREIDNQNIPAAQFNDESMNLQNRHDMQHSGLAIQLEEQLKQTALYGSLPLGVKKELEILKGNIIHWKEILWRYLSRDANDFEGFDRRFIHRGLYLEDLQSEQLVSWVCIDTSASVNEHKLKCFMAEVVSILTMHVNVKGCLYYADSELYGPYELDQKIHQAEGFGGTSFVPFFEAAVSSVIDKPDVLIYFTDGEGEYPDFRVDIPTLWIIDNPYRDIAPKFGEVTKINTER